MVPLREGKGNHRTSPCTLPATSYSVGLILVSVGFGWVFLFFLFDKFFFLGKEPGWERNVRKCEGQLPFASFGQFDMKETGWPLIMRPILRTD